MYSCVIKANTDIGNGECCVYITVRNAISLSPSFSLPPSLSPSLSLSLYLYLSLPISLSPSLVKYVKFSVKNLSTREHHCNCPKACEFVTYKHSVSSSLLSPTFIAKVLQYYNRRNNHKAESSQPRYKRFAAWSWARFSPRYCAGYFVPAGISEDPTSVFRGWSSITIPHGK